MDISTLKPIYHSERFRTPINAEKNIGLWVDRIGQACDRENLEDAPLRILGLYAVVSIESGNGFFFTERTGKLKVETGDVMLIFPEEPHCYYPENEWETKWIVWGGPEAGTLDELGLFKQSDVIIKGASWLVGDTHSKLSKIISVENIAAILERKTLILSMLLELRRFSKPEITHAEKFKEIISVISENYRENFTVPDLALTCGLSTTHFRREFKNYTGRSPKEFINTVKISKAKELLAQGCPIKEIAEILGYDDVFYFMRFFKKITGTAPGKFSKKQ
jgi:AraC-like DNA-binding protein